MQLNYYSHDKASYIIDELFGVACYLHHVTRGDGLRSIRNKIVTYFETQGGFMMMGGDLDASSKGIAGVHITTNDEIYLLVVVRIITICVIFLFKVESCIPGSTLCWDTQEC